MKLREFISKIFSIFTWFSLAILSVLVLYTISSNLSIFSGYSSYLVQSGSMEPQIHIGDVVVVQARPSYYPHDVITFKSEDASGRLVTHRIISQVQSKGTAFETQGDANRDQDEAQVNISDIVGKVIFVIPKIGILITFTRTIPGLMIFILLPTAGIVFDSLVKLSDKSKNAR